MATRCELFYTLVLLSIFRGGQSQPCTTANIKVTQRTTAEWAHGNPVYEVEVSNGCICSQSMVLLRCRGFDTTLSVDPSVFRQLRPSEAGGVHGLCVVNGFQPIFQGSPVKFRYARGSPIGLTADSSEVNCS
ncbi:unnamed protein product [Spirodela intermedia]|uniref:Uncharacterized protein n=1 Tax=Spirodela intermedia TaxID=51605 RepID=A0A7I8JAK5_SPIIN|nr:unnamed protein product [Spirodela intermedia]CAA6667150.1 unnamed protein product [Spirodela intermedia]